eukprot:8350624-Karenia_brevis.AAC.1
MDTRHHLDYLDARLSLPGFLERTFFIAWITWMDNPSLPGLPGWTICSAWITWINNLHCLEYFDGPSLLG